MRQALSKISILIAALVIAIGVSSCGTSRTVAGSTTPGKKSTTVSQPPTPQHIDLSGQLLPSTNALLREADTWIGTSYRYGGNDRSGIDCSGLVVNVFQDALGIKLPRTSKQQQEFCQQIDRNQLQKGDLIFFSGSDNSAVNHVGIYIGDDYMVHASSSRGVIISSLSSKYYLDNYHSAGRVEKYFSMVSSEQGKQKPTVTPTEQQPLRSTAPEQPQYAVVDLSKPNSQASPTVGSQTAAILRTARIGHVSNPTPTVEPTTAPTHQPDPATTEEGDSGLEELSEFFD